MSKGIDLTAALAAVFLNMIGVLASVLALAVSLLPLLVFGAVVSLFCLGPVLLVMAMR